MRTLAGKVVVVTGGASGIGLALAGRFHAEGAQLVLSDVDERALGEAVAGLGGAAAGVAGVRADVTAPASMEELRAAALDAHGAVDVVCLNAGVVATGPILETSLESWRWMLDVNVMGVVNGVAAFGPGLVEQGSGHLVLTASAAGVMNSPGLGAYGATKHAVVGLAANLHDELTPLGVGVSVLCPGVIRTPLFRGHARRPDALAGETHPDEQTLALYDRLVAEAPGPEVVAEAAVRAVLEERLFVLTGPEVGGLVTKRLRAVREALPPRPDGAGAGG
jgi:NAD(P)-dependent dehydrogenase (short-subunit alcohol dehydrogenase family)